MYLLADVLYKNRSTRIARLHPRHFESLSNSRRAPPCAQHEGLPGYDSGAAEGGTDACSTAAAVQVYSQHRAGGAGTYGGRCCVGKFRDPKRCVAREPPHPDGLRFFEVGRHGEEMAARVICTAPSTLEYHTGSGADGFMDEQGLRVLHNGFGLPVNANVFASIQVRAQVGMELPTGSSNGTHGKRFSSF